MKRFSTTLLAALATVFLLAGCGPADNYQWHGHDVTGVTADLAFQLVDGNKKTVNAGTYAGKVRLVYFGYTYCPDVCPATMAHLAAALGQLTSPQRNKVRVLFISVDPKRDTPQRLKQWTRHFGPDFIGLTGSQKELKWLANRYRISYSYDTPGKNGFYLVNHSSAVFVFDGRGKARLLLKQDENSKEIAEDLAHLIKQTT